MKNQWLLMYASAAVWLGAAPAMAQNVNADRELISTVRATLDYATKETEGPDQFFADLDSHSGRAIFLDLRIIPGSEPDSPGYSLLNERPPGSDKTDEIVCGSDAVGILDNISSDMQLAFQHPAHFHAPTTIVVGNRLQFPFNAIVCEVVDSANEQAELHLTGHFVVFTATIPTAVQYELSPYRP